MSRIYDDWIPVTPAKGAVKEVARALLDIAGDARLVRTEGNGGEFLVPSWVADRFTSPTSESFSANAEKAWSAAEPEPISRTREIAKPPRKRASRARKSEDQT